MSTTATETEVTARPIIFSAPMVNALLAGRKTMTRRLVKPQSIFDGKEEIVRRFPRQHDGPYGEPGDRLWVRESWRTYERPEDFVDGILYAADGAFVPIENTAEAADRWVEAHDNGKHKDRWRSPIYMPRWTSRLTLEITDVRVERLQDVNEGDAIREGATFVDHGEREVRLSYADSGKPAGVHRVRREGWSMEHPKSSEHCLGTARFAFGNYWQKLHGPASWDANPWLWVLSFRREAVPS